VRVYVNAKSTQALPQMQGSGLVRDLRLAMSLGTAQAATPASQADSVCNRHHPRHAHQRADQQNDCQLRRPQLKSSVYAALVTQTRLKPYLDSIGLVVDEAGVRFDTTLQAARYTLPQLKLTPVKEGVTKGGINMQFKGRAIAPKSVAGCAGNTRALGTISLYLANSLQTPAKPLRSCAVRAKTGCTPRARSGTHRFCPLRPQAPALLVSSQRPYGTRAHSLRVVST
jgi:hypothetical protein